MTKCCIDQSVVTLCSGGSQIKSVEEGQRLEQPNLEQQQQWKRSDQSNNDSHIQLDNGNILWNFNIDSDYELDSLRLARDGGILDWDDRVVDVLDDRELLIANFRRKLPTSLPNTSRNQNQLSYSNCNHQKSPQSDSVITTNDELFVRNQINLSTSVNNSSLAPFSSSLFNITSSSLLLTACSPSVTGRILCDTGVTYVQLPYPQRQQQTFQIIASSSSSSSSVSVTYSIPQRSQCYADHQHISSSLLSGKECLEESCDCFCLTESNINAKKTMYLIDNELKMNRTGQFQNIKPTGYNQYTSHPITTLIGGLEYELYSTKTPAAFRPPTNTSSVITTPTFSIKQTSVSTKSPLVHRSNRSAPPPPPPPPPPHLHHHQYSHGNSLLQMPISLPPLAQPCTIEFNRSLAQNPMHQTTTLTETGYYDYMNMPQMKLDDDHDVVHFRHVDINTTTTTNNNNNNNNNNSNNTPHTHIPTSILSLNDYLLSNSLLSTLNTTDINIITNVNNDDLLMDTSFLSTVPEEEDFSEITSSSRTTPKQSPCKQIYLMKHENKNFMKLNQHNNDIHDVGLYSSPESSSSPSTVLHKSQPIQIKEMESFSSSSGQTFSDGNVESQPSSSPSKSSKIHPPQPQEMSDTYCARPNRRQKRYRNSRGPAPPTPSVTSSSSSSSLPLSSCINQPTIPLPPPPPPRPTRNIGTPCTSDSDNDGDYKNSLQSKHNQKMSETSSSPVESGTSCEHKSDDSDKGNQMEQTHPTTTITSSLTTTSTTLIDDLDVIGKSQTHIVAILRIKPVGSIVNLLVRRHVHRCELHLHDCLTCCNMLHSFQLYSNEMNQLTRQYNSKYSTLTHSKYSSISSWNDLQVNTLNTRKCTSPPLSMMIHYDGLDNLESVHHPNYP
ncbi:hypothetical protein MN116_008477, partial [Schistosoma mekongi]